MHGDNDETGPAFGDDAKGPNAWGSGELLLMKLDVAAKALGDISTRELRRRAQAGDVEMVHIGRAAFITRRSIETYFERLCQEAAERLAKLRSESLGRAS